MMATECGAVGVIRIANGISSTQRKPYCLATLPTANPAEPDFGSNPGNQMGSW
jgi:hypothetical protein